MNNTEIELDEEGDELDFLVQYAGGDQRRRRLGDKETSISEELAEKCLIYLQKSQRM